MFEYQNECQVCFIKKAPKPKCFGAIKFKYLNFFKDQIRIVREYPKRSCHIFRLHLQVHEKQYDS